MITFLPAREHVDWSSRLWYMVKQLLAPRQHSTECSRAQARQVNMLAVESFNNQQGPRNGVNCLRAWHNKYILCLTNEYSAQSFFLERTMFLSSSCNTYSGVFMQSFQAELFFTWLTVNYLCPSSVVPLVLSLKLVASNSAVNVRLKLSLWHSDLPANSQGNPITNSQCCLLGCWYIHTCPSSINWEVNFGPLPEEYHTILPLSGTHNTDGYYASLLANKLH